MSDQRPPYLIVRDAVLAKGAPWLAQERLVALVLADYMRPGKAEAWPSVRTLGERCNLGDTAVRNALSALCSGDPPAFVKLPGDRPGVDPNRYAIGPALVDGCARRRGLPGEGVRHAKGFARRAVPLRPASFTPSPGEAEEEREEPREEEQPPTPFELFAHGDGSATSEQPPTARARKPKPTRAKVSTPGRHHDEAEQVAARFVAAHNAATGGRSTVLPKIRQRIEARLFEGYSADQLCAVPIIADALDRQQPPLTLLRDGSHPRTGPDGRTTGAYDWPAEMLAAAPRVGLFPRHVEAARAAGVLETLLELGARVLDEGDGAGVPLG